MALLDITPYNIKRFSHHSGLKTLVAEASDLNWAPGREDFVQLYDDACDMGIAVYNPRTDSTTHWYTVAEVTKDGDLTHWILQPTSESCRKHPGVQNYTMHILND